MSDTPKKHGFYIPEPKNRPGDSPDFGDMEILKFAPVAKPDISETSENLRHLPFQLVRTLTDDDIEDGYWKPKLSAAVYRKALRYMSITRIFDEKLLRMQRQGKTSFFLTSLGEEALGVVPSMALREDDMCFPTYRQVGWLIARDYPLLKLVNQILNNRRDPLAGKQLPVLYSAREYGFYSLSGNVGTRFGHSVGWAMAKAYRGSRDVAIGFIGDGSTAEGAFHEALTFASVYNAPVVLAVTNNQWAISTFSGLASSEHTTIASKGIAYGIPGIRVDGNDVLAVFSVLDWAAQRARAGFGATLIEFFTYRVGAHSSSDDPKRYRPADEPTTWPLGDPIDRLKKYLIKAGEWSTDQHDQMIMKIDALVTEAIKEAEAIGILGKSKPPIASMFEGVFSEPDWRHIEQMKELGI